MRGLDYNLFEEDLLRRCTPIQRQLLGDGVNIKGCEPCTLSHVTWFLRHTQPHDALSKSRLVNPSVL